MIRIFNQIASKRELLFSAESFHRNFPLLTVKRTHLEAEISQVIAEIDQLHLVSENSLAEKKKTLLGLKKEMQLLDTIWDEWEDLTENQLYTMREELLSEIWKQYPDQYEEQKQQWNELKDSLIQMTEIGKIQNLLRQLQMILQIVFKARASVKGSGLLRYIFGISPNAIIEKHLFAAYNLIESIEYELKQAIQHRVVFTAEHSLSSPLKTLLQEIFDHLDILKGQCKSIWGFKHIDSIMSNSERKLALSLESLQNYYENYQKKTMELKKKLDGWLYEI